MSTLRRSARMLANVATPVLKSAKPNKRMITTETSKTSAKAKRKTTKASAKEGEKMTTKASGISTKGTKRKKTALSSSSSSTSSSPKTWKFGTLTREMEQEVLAEGYEVVYGVDEAGRGPLAGPVVAAACMVPCDVVIEGVNDSKKLNEKERELLYTQLTTHPKIKYAYMVVDHDTIDTINILQASLHAMAESANKLDAQCGCSDITKSFVFVDGPHVPPAFKNPVPPRPSRPVVKGDSKCYSIAAASIIAKVTRDRMMKDLDVLYPEYGLAGHKGYPTGAHMRAVSKHGPSPAHRLTFAPIKTMDLSRFPEIEKKRDAALAAKAKLVEAQKQAKAEAKAAVKAAKKAKAAAGN